MSASNVSVVEILFFEFYKLKCENWLFQVFYTSKCCGKKTVSSDLRDKSVLGNNCFECF